MSDRHCLTVSGIPVAENTNRVQYKINDSPTTVPQDLQNTDFKAYIYDGDTDEWEYKDEWKNIHIYEGVKYYSILNLSSSMDAILLCYPIAFPLKDLNVTIHFGNSSSDHTGIEYGLYTTDDKYNPILYYDNGYIVTENGQRLNNILLNPLQSNEEHWIHFLFDGQQEKLIVEIKKEDASNDVEGLGYDRVEIPYSSFNLDLNQTCYVGVKSTMDGQEIWLKEFTAYWTKVHSFDTICELSSESVEYIYPNKVTGNCKVLSDFRTIYPLISKGEVSLTRYHGNSEVVIPLTRKTDSNGKELKNEFEFEDTPSPSTTSYRYTLRYHGNWAYEPTSYDENLDIRVKDVPKLTWNEPTGKLYYRGEETTLSCILEIVEKANSEDYEGTYVRAKNKTVQCEILKGGVLDTTLTGVTNSNGVVTVNYTPVDDGTYSVRWAFPVSSGDTERYELKRITRSINVIHKSLTSLSVSRGATVQYYPNTITITATLKNENNATLNNTPVEFFYYTSKNNSPVSLGVVNTNNRGIATITPNLPPLIDDPNNSTISDCYYIYVKYYGDDLNAEVTSPSYSFKYINPSTLSLEGSYTNELVVKSELSVSVKLVDGDGVLSGQRVNYSLGVDGGNVLKTGSATTNANGIITFKYTNSTVGDVDSTLTFTYPNNTSDGITGCSISFPIRWNKMDSEWATIGTDGVYETDCKEYCKWSTQLKAKDGTLLPQTSVKREITVTNFDGSIAPEGTILTNTSNSEFLTGVRNTTTNNNSQIIISPKCNYGDIKAVVKFTYEGNDLYHSSSISKTLKWNKIVTVWEDVYSSNIGYELFETECTLYCRWKGRIKGVDNHLFPDQPTRWKLVVTNLTGGTEPGTTLYEAGGVEIPKNTWSNYPHVLTNSGIEDFAMMSVYGDVKVVVTFYFDGDNCYKPANITKTFKWNRIETELVTYDLTHYATRYTNLEWDSVNAIDTSPGTNPEYKNIKALLQVINTETDFHGLADKPVVFKHGSNLFFETAPLTNSDGYILERWKRDSVGTSIVDVTFAGDKQFKPISSTMKVTTLPRIQPTITTEYEVLHPRYGLGDYRYNIPFNIDCWINYTVKEDGVDVVKPLCPCKVEFVFEGVSKGFKNPNNQGKFEINGIRPSIVGELSIVYKYNESDLIDPYLPTTRTDTKTVEKDSPALVFENMPKILTNGCTKYTPRVKFINSINEPITNSESVDLMHWWENVGDSVDGELWEKPDDSSDLLPNNQGKSSKEYDSWSGVKLVKVTYDGSWRFLRTHQTSYLKWNINEVYADIPAREGYAIIPLDCKIPDGLYDIKVEYYNNGECSTYSSSTLYKGIRKKQQSMFVLIPNNYYNVEDNVFYIEAGQPLTVTTELRNVTKNVDMPNTPVITKIDNANAVNDTTDDYARVSREYICDIVEADVDYSFEYKQTRKIAGTSLTTTEHTGKYIVMYEYIVKGTDEDNLDKLRENSEIGSKITTNTNTDYRFYSRPDDNDNVNYYFRRGNESPITITEATFTDATTIINFEDNPFPMYVRAYILPNNKFTVLNSATLVWKDGSGDELGRAVTDKNGVACLNTYHRKVTEGFIPKIYVGIAESETYESTRMPLYLDTRNYKTLTVTNNLAKIEGEYEGIYHVKIILNAIVKDEKNRAVKGLNVRFKSGSTLMGTCDTDNNGLASIEYVPVVGKDFAYQVTSPIIGVYNKIDKIFTVHNKKQTPQLKLTVDAHSNGIWYTDETVTGKIELKESENAVPIKDSAGNDIQAPLKSKDVYFVLVDNNGTEYSNVYTAKTDSNGKASFSIVPTGIGENMFVKTYFIGEKTQNGTVVDVDKYYASVETIGQPKDSNGQTIPIKVRKIPVRLALQASKDSESGWRWKNNNPATNTIIAPAYIELGINAKLEDTRTLIGYEKEQDGKTDFLDANGNKIPIYAPIKNQQINIAWEEEKENHTTAVHNMSLTTNENGIVTQVVKGGLSTIHYVTFTYAGNAMYEQVSSPRCTMNFQTTRAVFYKHNTTVFERDKDIDISVKCVYLNSNGDEVGIKNGIPIKLYNGPYKSYTYNNIPSENDNDPLWSRNYYTTVQTGNGGVARATHKFTKAQWMWASPDGYFHISVLTQFPFSEHNFNPQDPLLQNINWSDYPFFNTSIWCEINDSKEYIVGVGGGKDNYHYKTDYTYAKQFQNNVIENVYPIGPENEVMGYQCVHLPYGNILAPRIFMISGNCTISYTFVLSSKTGTAMANDYGFIIGLSKTIGTWNDDSKTPLKIEYRNKNYFKIGGVTKSVTFSKDKEYTLKVVIENGVIKSVSVGTYEWYPNTNISSFLNSTVGLKFFIFTAFGDNNTEIEIKEFKGKYN